MFNHSFEGEKYFSFFNLLSNTERIKFQHFLQYHTLSKDKNLMIEEKKLGLIAVKTGCLKLFIISKDGREINLFSIQPGEVAVLSPQYLKGLNIFDIQLEAEVNTEFFNLSPLYLEELCRHNSILEKFCFEKTLDHFSQVMQVMDQMLFNRMDQRLASYILEKVDHEGLLIKTHAKIAKDLGTAREVVSRILNAFAKKGWINLQRGQIHLISPKALEHIAKKDK